MKYKFFGAFIAQLQNQFYILLDSCWFSWNHLILSSLLDLVVLWFQDLFMKLDAASYVVVGRSFAVCLLEIPASNGRVAQWMCCHYATCS